MTVTEHKLKRLFADRGYRVREIRLNKHYWVKVQKETGGPQFAVAVPVVVGEVVEQIDEFVYLVN